jgi:thioredoxin-related protein
MKKLLLFLFLLVAGFGYAQNWQTNFEVAKSLAVKENKNILLVFSGSDWCAPCIKLENVVWKSEVFKTEAEKKWILERADFPKKKNNQLSPELSANNKLLAEIYNKGGSFPLVVLLENSGKVIGMTGFKNVPADQYLTIIHALEK